MTKELGLYPSTRNTAINRSSIQLGQHTKENWNAQRKRIHDIVKQIKNKMTLSTNDNMEKKRKETMNAPDNKTMNEDGICFSIYEYGKNPV